jgi:hypothetical protein
MYIQIYILTYIYIGSEMHGLTITGKIQARRAAALLIEEVKRENLKNIVFLSSNFMRARETASETLQVNVIFVYIHIYIYIYIYINVYIYVYIHFEVYTYTTMYTYISI